MVTVPERGGEVFGALFINRVYVTIEDSSFTNNVAEAGDSTVPEFMPQPGDQSGRRTWWRDHRNECRTDHDTDNVTGNEISGGECLQPVTEARAFGGGIFVEGVNDGLGLYMSTINMSDCYVAENLGTSGSAGTGGKTAGGGFDSVDSQVTIDRSQFINNSIIGGSTIGTGYSGNGSGGGLFIWALRDSMPQATLTNVVIADNYANQGSGSNTTWHGGGGGLFIWGIDAEIRHATFARNRLGPEMTNGEAFYLDTALFHHAIVSIYDSIISDHNLGLVSASLGNVNTNNTLNLSRGIFAANGSNTISGVGIVNGTYTAVSSAGYISSGSTQYNYHLRSDSPAEDAATSSPTNEDFESQSRPYGSSRDYGADEYHPFPLFAGIGDGTLQVDWTSEIAYLEGGIDHYKLTVTCEAGASAPDQVSCGGGGIDVGQVTHLTLTGLTNGKIYSIQIKAYDSSNVMIATSNAIDVVPTDLRFFIPLIRR